MSFQNVSKFLFIVLVILFVVSCGKKTSDQNEDATLSLSLVFPSPVSSTSTVQSRELANAKYYDLEKVIVTLSDSSGTEISSTDVLYSANVVDFSVPANIALTVRGEAFIDGNVAFHGETQIAAIPAGGSAEVSFEMLGAGKQLIQVGLEVNGKSLSGVKAGGVFSKNDLLIFGSAGLSSDANANQNISEIYTADLKLGQTSLLTTISGTQAINNFIDADISADGQYVVFTTTDPLLDIDKDVEQDVYLKNTKTGVLSLVSKNIPKQDSTEASYSPSISDDGRLIVFTAQGVYNGVAVKNVILVDRLTSVYKNIDSGHRPKLSGDGSAIVYMKEEKNILSFFRVKESVIGKLVDVLDQSYPGFEYAISYSGKAIAYAFKGDVGKYQDKQIFVAETSDFKKFTITPAPLDNYGDPLVIASNFNLNLGIDDEGRFLVFNFNNNVYVKNLISSEVSLVASGSSPFISADGFNIAYSKDEDIFIKTNPFLKNLERPVRNVIELKSAETIPVEHGVRITWPAVSDASYYRIYVSGHSGILSGDAGEIVIYETTGLSVVVLDKNISGSPDKLFFAISAVNSMGEQLLIDEKSEKLQSTATGLYQFEFAISELNSLQGNCNFDSLKIGDKDWSFSAAVINESDTLLFQLLDGVQWPVVRNEQGEVVLIESGVEIFRMDYDSDTEQYSATYKKIYKDSNSNLADSFCEKVLTGTGVRVKGLLSGDEELSGTYVVGQILNEESDNVVAKDFSTIKVDSKNNTIQFGDGFYEIIENKFDPLTGFFSFVADNLGESLQANNNDISDLVVERLVLDGIFSYSNYTGEKSFELKAKVDKRYYYDGSERSSSPGLVNSEELGILVGKSVKTKTINQLEAVVDGQAVIKHELIGIVNPPWFKDKFNSNVYLYVSPEVDPNISLCESDKYIEIRNQPEIHLSSVEYDDQVYAQVTCSLEPGSLLPGINYLLTIMSDPATPDNKSDDVVLTQFIHTIKQLEATENKIDLSTIRVNGLPVINGAINGFINKNEDVVFELPNSIDAIKYFVSMHPEHFGSWDMTHEEIRAAGSEGLVKIDISSRDETVYRVRIMAREGDDLNRVSLSDEFKLDAGINGDFNLYLGLEGGVKHLLLSLTTDNNGNVFCSSDTADIACSATSGWIDWKNSSVTFNLTDNKGLFGASGGTRQMELVFDSADTAHVSVGEAIGTAFAGWKKTGGNEFQNISIAPENAALTVTWVPIPEAHYYEVYISPVLGDLYSKETSTLLLKNEKVIDANNVRLEGLENGVVYYVRINAVFASGENIDSLIMAAVPEGDAANLVYQLTFADENLQVCVKSSGAVYIDSLTKLDCSYRDIVDITGVERLTALTELILKGNMISRVPDLSLLNKLIVLDLSNNRISEIPASMNLPSLESLTLNSNQLQVLPDFSGLENLKYLYVTNNLIQTIPNFSNLPLLATLYLDENQITDFTNLVNLNKLRFLSLSNNNITTISTSLNMPELIELDLSGNTLTSVPDLFGIEQLNYLKLTGNDINAVANFTALPELFHIELTSNPISDLPDFKLTSLSELILTENPEIACDHFAALDISYDMGDGEGAGFIQWNECSTPTNAKIISQFDFENNIDLSVAPWAMKINNAVGSGWQLSNVSSYSGLYSIQTNNLVSGNEVSIFLKVTTESEGYITFAKHISAAGGGELIFNIDGIEKNNWHGNLDWSVSGFKLPAGEHQVEWNFRNKGVEGIIDDAWIDDVTIYAKYSGLSSSLLTNNQGFEESSLPQGWGENSAGALGWELDAAISYSGAQSIRSISITNNETSSIKTSVNMNANGYISFVKKVSSEEKFDNLTFFIDGKAFGKWSGESDWELKVYELSSGAHALEWQYSKDSNNDEGADAAWIDDFKVYEQQVLP